MTSTRMFFTRPHSSFGVLLDARLVARHPVAGRVVAVGRAVGGGRVVAVGRAVGGERGVLVQGVVVLRCDDSLGPGVLLGSPVVLGRSGLAETDALVQAG